MVEFNKGTLIKSDNFIDFRSWYKSFGWQRNKLHVGYFHIKTLHEIPHRNICCSTNCRLEYHCICFGHEERGPWERGGEYECFRSRGSHPTMHEVANLS